MFSENVFLLSPRSRSGVDPLGRAINYGRLFRWVTFRDEGFLRNDLERSKQKIEYFFEMAAYSQSEPMGHFVEALRWSNNADLKRNRLRSESDAMILGSLAYCSKTCFPDDPPNQVVNMLHSVLLERFSLFGIRYIIPQGAPKYTVGYKEIDKAHGFFMLLHQRLLKRRISDWTWTSDSF